MKISKIRGIVINKNNYGEADRIITVFTKEFGKKKLILKGIRKSKKRDIYASEILVISNFVIYEKGDRNIVSKLEVEEVFLKLKETLFKIEISSYILKILNLIIMENERREKLYKITEKSLKYIEKTDGKIKNLILILYYILILLKDEGLKIEINEKGFYFNLEYGKIEEERKKDSIKLTEIEKKIMMFLENNKVDLILKLNPTGKTILKIISYFEKYLEYHMEIKIRINDFFKEEE